MGDGEEKASRRMAGVGRPMQVGEAGADQGRKLHRVGDVSRCPSWERNGGCWGARKG